MRVAKSITGYPNKLKTKLQWAKIGYVPTNGATGTKYWTNQFCNKSSIYYSDTEVRQGSKEEIDDILRPSREKRNEQARKQRYLIRQMKRLEKASALEAQDVQNPTGVIVFDVETTGLDSEHDEIIQISIIDGSGNVLINEYVKPYWMESWGKASAINGIYPKDVENAPYPESIIPKVKGIFASAKVLIAYNGIFDLNFLANWGIWRREDQEYIDVMIDFAEVFGEWNEKYQEYKWQKLTNAAAYYGYQFAAHDSLEDVRATLFVHQQMKKGSMNT